MKTLLKIALFNIIAGAGILSAQASPTCNTTLNSNPLTANQTIPLNGCINFNTGNLTIAAKVSGKKLKINRKFA
ncbi:MAG: hypothetical protein ABSB19_12705 [Methylomonas sp.]|jgi:hypothetical protein